MVGLPNGLRSLGALARTGETREETEMEANFRTDMVMSFVTQKLGSEFISEMKVAEETIPVLEIQQDIAEDRKTLRGVFIDSFA